MTKTMKAAVVREFGKPLTIDLPAQHLRHGAERHYGARLDRRHPPPSAGVVGVRGARQGESDGLARQDRRHQDIFVRMHKGQIEGRIVLDMAA